MRMKSTIRGDGDMSSREMRLVRRHLLSCSFCRPHRGENARRKARDHKTSWRRKAS